MNTIKSPNPDNIHWSENIIIADADYIDYVAFNLIVNFERMLGRRIPPADLSRWAMDVALDGGLREGKHETQVVLIHDKGKTALENFRPATYATDLSGKAFNDGKLGEFIINSIDAGDSNADKESIITDIMTMLLNHKEVKRIMVVPDAEHTDIWHTLAAALNRMDDAAKHITLFAMQPMEGGNFRQQILGYSLMNAMGITQQEIDSKIK